MTGGVTGGMTGGVPAGLNAGMPAVPPGLPAGPARAPRRIAVTGLGAICALGHDVTSLWAALCAGRVGIAGEPGPAGGLRAAVTGFDPAAHLPERELPALDRVSQFARVAGAQALAQAGLAGPGERAALDATRCGAVYAAGIGHGTLDDAYRALYQRGAARLHPLVVPRGMPSAPASQLSMAFGLRGPSLAAASACASGAHAVALAALFIRWGLLDLALTGGAEASLVPGMLTAWEGLRVQAGDACRPFSADRTGLVLGEGAAALVLEDWDHAAARGATVLAEVAGVGLSADAGDLTAPSADGAAQALRAALADAGEPPAAVGYVNAHGTGTRLNDRSESAALAQVFGAGRVLRPGPGALPVSSCKGQIGHTLNAAGALEALATVLALREGRLPPTAGWRTPDPECVADCVPHESRRAADLALAASSSFAFGGLNAVLLLRRADRHAP